MLIKLENGSTIEPMPSENNTRGKGVWATPINKPDHIELSAQTFEDRIEYSAFNTLSRKEQIAQFYFKESESPVMSHLKQLQIIENLVNKVK